MATRTIEAHAVARLYEDLLESAAQDHARAARQARWRRRRALERSPCPFCEQAARWARRSLAALASAEPSGALAAAARAEGRWLCAPHAEAGIVLAARRSEAQVLASLARDGVEDVRASLADWLQTLRGHDSPRPQPTTGQRFAWRQAVVWLSGQSRAGDDI